MDVIHGIHDTLTGASSRQVPDGVDVLGIADASAIVTVNDLPTSRKGA